MTFDLLNKISSKYKDYKVEKIKKGASKRYFYRLSDQSNSVICLDSSNEKKEYNDLLKVYSYLSKKSDRRVEQKDMQRVLKQV